MNYIVESTLRYLNDRGCEAEIVGKRNGHGNLELHILGYRTRTSTHRTWLAFGIGGTFDSACADMAQDILDNLV